MSRGQQEPTIWGRARIAPTGSKSQYGHANNFTADSRVRCDVNLTALSAADGQPVDPTLTKVEADLPNWLLRVFYSAGNTDELSESLPPFIEVNVAIGQQSRRCVAIDVEGAIAELQAYRDVGVDDWKHEGSALAPVRNVLGAPKQGWKALKGLKGGMKDLVADVKGLGASGPPTGGSKPSYTPEQVEQIRRQAAILGLRYQQHPNEYAQGRNAALQAMPMYVQMLHSGAIHPNDFDVELMRHATSGALNQQEAEDYHRRAYPQTEPPPPPASSPGH
jgi:hypothetical protein